MKSIYDVDLKSATGEPNFMEQYKGKVTMIVNTTVGCGFANQFEVLEWLHAKYKDRGFEIIALPTNDYCGPGVTKGEWSTFKYSEKVNSVPNTATVGDLNGIDQPFGEPSEIYKVITEHAEASWDEAVKLGIHKPVKEYYSWWLCQGFYNGQTMAANFEKYLVDKDGYVAKHYPPSVLTLDVEKTLKDNLLKELGLPYGDLGAEYSRIDRQNEVKIGEGGRIEIAPDHILMVSQQQKTPPGPGHGRSYKLFEEEYAVVCSHIEELLDGKKSLINKN